MTIFRTPELGPSEEDALDRIRELWRTLSYAIQTQPHRWTGLLIRGAFARGIQGSNSIEGYNVSDDDAMAAVDGEEPFHAVGETWAAVKGYREAMTYVLRLAADPHSVVDLSLVRSLHFMMLSYDLSKSPGAWRLGPIYVHSDIESRRVYEAPDVDLVPSLMDELISQVSEQAESVSPMVQAAMAHLNLVMIHPFRDGNGRMGRCLQTLVLARAGLYDAVFCSVEEYLGRNRQDYYRVLAEVGVGSWNPDRDAMPWIRLMLTAQYRQAATFRRRNAEIGAIWSELDEVLKKKGLPDRASSSLVHAALGGRIRNSRYRQDADVTSNLASRDLKELVAARLLVAHGERRGRWYERSDELLQIRDSHRHPKPVAGPFEV